MSRLRWNILANFAGNAWSALLAVALIPLYIRFMGIESYGLVGFYVMLQAAFSILSMALSITLTRELAALSVSPDGPGEMRNLVRTLEVVNWGGALAIAAIVAAMAPLAAHGWFQAGQLSPEAIEQTITIMGLALVFQWPLGFYSGGLLGLQRQVLLNGLSSAMAALRGGGAILTLWLISPTIQAFFLWQVGSSAVQVLLTAGVLWRCLPTSHSAPRFDLVILGRTWRFATGVSGITLMMLIQGQLDKVLLSKLLTLESFGYYTAAATAASVINYFGGPVTAALFPRLTQLVQTDREGLPGLYHRTCQLLSLLVLPPALVLALFSPELLLIWLRRPEAVENTHRVFSLLVMANALNALMNAPYALQGAAGHTRPVFYQFLASNVLLVPAILWSAGRFGAVGVALVLLLLQVAYVAGTLPFLHSRTLPGEHLSWLLRDTMKPLLASGAAVLAARWTMPGQLPAPAALAWIAAAYLMALSVQTMSSPQLVVVVRPYLRYLQPRGNYLG